MAKDETKAGQASVHSATSGNAGQSAASDRMAKARSARGGNSRPDKSPAAKVAVNTLRQIRNVAKMLIEQIEFDGQLPDGVDLSILTDAQAVITRAVK